MKNEDGTLTVTLKHKGEESTVQAAVVMFGTGRKPNSRNIGLEVSNTARALYPRAHNLLFTEVGILVQSCVGHTGVTFCSWLLGNGDENTLRCSFCTS